MTKLQGAYFDYRAECERADKKRTALKTRRGVRGLIERGLLEYAGEIEVKRGGPEIAVPGEYLRKGYTRLSKAYRLTPSGRALATMIMNKART